ncbi:CBS domain-containing protein [Natranaeroarchaeum aerophilus]|uniref:CBS domain-containing protein n=1 Tax=Natranaeroarchaeum aerophilus TaxID=2917711 RepID=A0AAE3K738_9EURY|nr:CBS domain-containing protein [Natranaeroarchaeum aerophilus]MCL9815020.1 CBS domain-containing protein [Natranaeroarchaeum aerophilus]
MVRTAAFMTEPVETVRRDDRVDEVLERLAQADFEGFPVVDDDERVVGIVTQTDLVRLFRKKDRIVWIPIGVPPFSETVTYGFDLSLDELDIGIDAAKAARKPISEIMTEDVVTVSPDTELDEIVVLLTDEDRDINRLPVVEDDRIVGIVTREDALRAVRDNS